MCKKSPAEHRQADSPLMFLFRPFAYWPGIVRDRLLHRLALADFGYLTRRQAIIFPRRTRRLNPSVLLCKSYIFGSFSVRVPGAPLFLPGRSRLAGFHRNFVHVFTTLFAPLVPPEGIQHPQRPCPRRFGGGVGHDASRLAP